MVRETWRRSEYSIGRVAPDQHQRSGCDRLLGGDSAQRRAGIRRYVAGRWRTALHVVRLSHNACSRRGPSRPTEGVLALSEHTRGAVLRCDQAGGGRRSGALFGARAGVLDRQLGRDRAYPTAPEGEGSSLCVPVDQHTACHLDSTRVRKE